MDCLVCRKGGVCALSEQPVSCGFGCGAVARQATCNCCPDAACVACVGARVLYGLEQLDIFAGALSTLCEGLAQHGHDFHSMVVHQNEGEDDFLVDGSLVDTGCAGFNDGYDLWGVARFEEPSEDGAPAAQ